MCCLAAPLLVAAPLHAQSALAEHTVALKASMAASQAILRSYEWVETTVISLKGEEKARTMDRCYYGADGQMQKIPLMAPPPEEKKRGLRGKIIEAKKEEMADYIKEAVALVKLYVPPDSMRIQVAKDAGKVSITPLSAQRARLTFSGYFKPNDSFTIDLDLANNRPVEAKVSTYLDSQKEPVTLDVRFGLLDNNASYSQNITLEAKGKNLVINVTNSGYRRQ
jgi:hypothetical protein